MFPCWYRNSDTETGENQWLKIILLQVTWIRKKKLSEFNSRTASQASEACPPSPPNNFPF